MSRDLEEVIKKFKKRTGVLIPSLPGYTKYEPTNLMEEMVDNKIQSLKNEMKMLFVAKYIEDPTYRSQFSSLMLIKMNALLMYKVALRILQSIDESKIQIMTESFVGGVNTRSKTKKNASYRRRKTKHLTKTLKISSNRDEQTRNNVYNIWLKLMILFSFISPSEGGFFSKTPEAPPSPATPSPVKPTIAEIEIIPERKTIAKVREVIGNEAKLIAQSQSKNAIAGPAQTAKAIMKDLVIGVKGFIGIANEVEVITTGDELRDIIDEINVIIEEENAIITKELNEIMLGLENPDVDVLEHLVIPDVKSSSKMVKERKGIPMRKKYDVEFTGYNKIKALREILKPNRPEIALSANGKVLGLQMKQPMEVSNVRLILSTLTNLLTDKLQSSAQIDVSLYQDLIENVKIFTQIKSLELQSDEQCIEMMDMDTFKQSKVMLSDFKSQLAHLKNSMKELNGVFGKGVVSKQKQLKYAASVTTKQAEENVNRELLRSIKEGHQLELDMNAEDATYEIAKKMIMAKAVASTFENAFTGVSDAAARVAINALNNTGRTLTGAVNEGADVFTNAVNRGNVIGSDFAAGIGKNIGSVFTSFGNEVGYIGGGIILLCSILLLTAFSNGIVNVITMPIRGVTYIFTQSANGVINVFKSIVGKFSRKKVEHVAVFVPTTQAQAQGLNIRAIGAPEPSAATQGMQLQLGEPKKRRTYTKRFDIEPPNMAPAILPSGRPSRWDAEKNGYMTIASNQGGKKHRKYTRKRKHYRRK